MPTADIGAEFFRRYPETRKKRRQAVIGKREAYLFPIFYVETVDQPGGVVFGDRGVRLGVVDKLKG